jgi:hypothetical protein
MKKFAQIVRKLLILLEKSSIFLLRKRNMNRPIPTLASIVFLQQMEGFGRRFGVRQQKRNKSVDPTEHLESTDDNGKRFP